MRKMLFSPKMKTRKKRTPTMTTIMTIRTITKIRIMTITTISAITITTTMTIMTAILWKSKGFKDFVQKLRCTFHQSTSRTSQQLKHPFPIQPARYVQPLTCDDETSPTTLILPFHLLSFRHEPAFKKSDKGSIRIPL